LVVGKLVGKTETGIIIIDGEFGTVMILVDGTVGGTAVVGITTGECHENGTVIVGGITGGVAIVIITVDGTELGNSGVGTITP
jgi:hypothetical protein